MKQKKGCRSIARLRYNSVTSMIFQFSSDGLVIGLSTLLYDASTDYIIPFFLLSATKVYLNVGYDPYIEVLYHCTIKLLV